MDLGYYDAKIVSYTTGTNDNGKKLMDVTVQFEGGKTNIQIYFASPENIKISLERLRSFGWEKGRDLDCIIGADTRIEIYDDTFQGRDGDDVTTRKAKFVGKPAVTQRMTKDAAQSWLEGLDKPATPGAPRSW